MISLTHRSLAPIACLILVSGFLLTSLLPPWAETVSAQGQSTKPSPTIYALVNVGKGEKGVPDEKYREDERDWFIGGLPWCALRDTQAAKLNVVQAQKDMRDWLNKNLHAEYVGNTDELRIWLTDGSPAEQAVIVNTIVRAYLQNAVQTKAELLKLGIATCERNFARCFEAIPRLESELLQLNNVVPIKKKEQEYLLFYRNLLARALAAEKKGLVANRDGIDASEAALRTLPRLLKWAENPRPVE